MNTDQSDVDVAGSWVYIVEDDASVRDSLSLLLQLRGFSTATFDSAEAFLDGDTLERPACVLVDVRLPGMSGLELQRKLAGRHAALPFVVMTAHGDVATARAALRDGAVDFLEKPIDEQDLIDRRLTLEAKEARDLISRLTQREAEVLEMVAKGLTTRQISDALGLSSRTVDSHRAAIAAKIGTASTAEQTRLWLDGRATP